MFQKAYKKSKNPQDNKEASTGEIILAGVEDSFVGVEDMVEPIELCLADVERYADTIEYESHEKRCTDSAEYEPEQKSVDSGSVKFIYLSNFMGGRVAPSNVTDMYTHP